MTYTTGSIIVSLLALGLPALMIVNLWLMRRALRRAPRRLPDDPGLLRARAAAIAASAAAEAAAAQAGPPAAPARPRPPRVRGVAPLVPVA